MRALSLFSGAGGLDLGFEAAGFEHAGCVESHAACAQTLRANRPGWDVRHADIRALTFAPGHADVVQGGPPCQPFSVAGRGAGEDDPRNMWPEFQRAVREVAPAAFVAENVRGLLRPRFADFVRDSVVGPLEALGYACRWYPVRAVDVDVPQSRVRVFLVGLRSAEAHLRFAAELERRKPGLLRGARAALGLPDDRPDGPCPTIVSTFTSPRLTTSIDSGPRSQRAWRALGIWPCGVQATAEAARAMPVAADPELHRLCVDEVRRLQGFPGDWELAGPRSVQLGMLGNSVPPPMARLVASALRATLDGEPRP